MTDLVEGRLEGRHLVVEINEAAIEEVMQLACCYVIVTDVDQQRLSAQVVHDSCVSLQKVERDFRTLNTGLLEVRPGFVSKESRTHGHLLPACGDLRNRSFKHSGYGCLKTGP